MRIRKLDFPFGDQSLFCRRALFDELRGFSPIPLFEDVDFVRRARLYGRIRYCGLNLESKSAYRWIGKSLRILENTLDNHKMMLFYYTGWESEASLHKRT